MSREKMESYQIGFFNNKSISQDNKKLIKELFSLYGCNICCVCLCNTCIYSVEQACNLTKEETCSVGENGCFNCDECWFYGHDNKLRKDIVKFACQKYKKTEYYIELYARQKRAKFKKLKGELKKWR